MNLDVSTTRTTGTDQAPNRAPSPTSRKRTGAPTSTLWHRLWPWARLLSGPLGAVVAIVILQSGTVPLYTEFTIGLAAVYALMVLSLSLLASWTGIWSIGHPALVAI